MESGSASHNSHIDHKSNSMDRIVSIDALHSAAMICRDGMPCLVNDKACSLLSLSKVDTLSLDNMLIIVNRLFRLRQNQSFEHQYIGDIILSILAGQKTLGSIASSEVVLATIYADAPSVEGVTNLDRFNSYAIEISIYAMPDMQYQVMVLFNDISDQFRMEKTLSHRNKVLDSILNNTREAVVVITPDGAIDLVSGHAEVMFGYDALEMTIAEPISLFAKVSQESIQSNLEVLATDQSIDRVFIKDILAQRSSGEIFPCSVAIARSEYGANGVYIVTIADQSNFRAFVESINDSYLCFSKDGCLIDCNSQAEQILGIRKKNALTKSFGDMLIGMMAPGDDSCKVFSTLDNFLSCFYKTKDVEFWVGWGSKISIPISLTVWPQQGESEVEYNFLIKDQTVQKNAEIALRYNAHYDSLTNIPNRTYFLNALQNLIEQHDDSKPSFAVMFLDLDRFKKVNDSMGHVVGDQLLIAVANRLKSCLRSNDIIARLGGDEFTILVSEVANEGFAISVAKRMVETLRTPYYIDSRKVNITGSVGVTIFPEFATSMEMLLKTADLAMYSAKENGRNKVRSYNESLRTRTERKISIESKLRMALDNHEFSLVYQPKVSVTSGNIVGFESLIRWKSGDEYISPYEFIPVAEEAGFIIDIDRWVADTAARQMKSWMNNILVPSSSIVFSINTSALHLSHELEGDILDILHRYKLEPERLEVEVTESALMKDIRQSSKVLDRLKDIGVRISIDDFGTGYSALNYIVDLPVDTIKIDKSFVNNISNNTKAQHLISAMVAMSKSMGIDIIVEGVETQDQLLIVKGLGCDIIQGYFYSKPMPPLDIEDFFLSHNGFPKY